MKESYGKGIPQGSVITRGASAESGVVSQAIAGTLAKFGLEHPK